MNKREGGLGLLLALAIALLWANNSAKGSAEARVGFLEATIPAIAAQRDSAERRAEDATERALGAEERLTEVQEEADVRIAEAEGELVVQLDTIDRVVMDTAAVRAFVAQRDTFWMEIVDQKDSVIIAQDSTITFWRASSFAKDTVIMRQDSVEAVKDEINADLRAALRSRTRRQWGERVLMAGAVLCILRC